MFRAAPFLLCLGLLVAPLASQSQTAPINNTGCPGAAYPTATSTKLGTMTTLGVPSHGPTAFSWVRLTFHAGFTTALPQPLACAAGCRLYGDTSVELLWVSLPQGVNSLSFTIPNNPALLVSYGTIAVQSLAWVPGTSCVDLDGAISFVFVP